MTDSNSAEDRLHRVFHEADELIFQAANFPDTRVDKDGAAKQIYQLLVDLHQNYHRLFLAYEELGKLGNDKLDISDRIEDQMKYDTEKKMEKLKKDYEAFLRENDEMAKKIAQHKRH